MSQRVSIRKVGNNQSECYLDILDSYGKIHNITVDLGVIRQLAIEIEELENKELA